MQFPKESETLLHAVLNFYISGWSLYQETRGSAAAQRVQCTGERSGDSLCHAEFSISCSAGLTSKKHTARRVISGTVVTRFGFGCAETYACGKKNDRDWSLARENMPLPPSYKSSYFPIAMISPELVTPSEMLICTRICDSETLARLSEDMKRLRYLKEAPVFLKASFSCGLSLTEFIQYIRVQGHNLQRTQAHTWSKNLQVKKTYLPQKSLWMARRTSSKLGCACSQFSTIFGCLGSTSKNTLLKGHIWE